jgi:RNA polymerase sigma-70 factor
LTDNRTRFVNTSSESEFLDNLTAGAADLDAIYARCAEAYPEVDLSREDFKEAVKGAVDKYLIGFAKEGEIPTAQEIRKFISELQDLDLYLTLACARGDEQAWWQFDRQYRSFIERLAHQLVGRGMDANEVIDSAYVELYGTKTVDGVRQSKFRTYTGRGTLRGWLRTVISHAAVDLYRGRPDEIPLEEWSNSGDEMSEGQRWRTEAHGSENSMLEKVARERYRSVTIAALGQSLATLDAHETLLLLYYHVEGLKLREIARLVEAPTSSIRRWFQRRSKRQGNSPTRVHESTVMRWLDNVYRKVSDRFQSELKNTHGLNQAEIDICLDIATEDCGQGVSLNLEKAENKSFSKGEAGNCQVEGAS